MYNLGVHNLANNDAFMFMWHEGCSTCGASEIGSCIWKFLELQLLEGSSSVTAFADSCGGQNRNFKIAALMSHCVATQVFPWNLSHFTSCNLGTRIFQITPISASLRNLKKQERTSTSLNTGCSWYEKHENNPFKVVEMKASDFLDLEKTTRLSIWLTEKSV